ncbi:hypothetical protein HEQ63_08730 [Haematospirillum jordaniae]|uniref:DUF6691 family protein n=1 Tax=Haematospirillum jordaniae TaxID=1549855 RepID=UPI0014333E02|nr:DUF6691 family protein [Haematospirillum jordaniae]NKD86264.1 hypothetical protein [Haematospirillum jordaniae]
MAYLAPCLSGILFGMGLLLSGMASPAKVQGFLDISRNWDPSLALVMVGAIGVSWPAFRFVKRRGGGVAGCALYLPTKQAVDVPLVVGSLMFGAGWGLAGICPGPALVLAGYGFTDALYFVSAMLIGMVIFELASWVKGHGIRRSP